MCLLPHQAYDLRMTYDNFVGGKWVPSESRANNQRSPEGARGYLVAGHRIHLLPRINTGNVPDGIGPIPTEIGVFRPEKVTARVTCGRQNVSLTTPGL